jgi:hypothetical protein
MPTKITAGGASDSLAITGGNDGALTLETGPSGGKVAALAMDASGNGALLGVLTQAGVATPRMQLLTAQNTTSGTFVDFPSTPSWTRKMTVMLNGVSTSGTSELMYRIGVGGTPDTSGYLGASSFLAASSMGTANYTAGFGAYNSVTAADVRHGAIVLTLQNSATNTWVCSGGFGLSNNSLQVVTFGSKALSGPLGVFRLTTVGGTDTFDLGSVNILYEGY